MNNTNETEVKENKKILHIIKCEERKIDFYGKLSQKTKNINEQLMILMSECLKIKMGSIVANIVCIIFIIVGLATLISDNKSYKKFREYLLSNPDTIIFQNYTNFWNDIRKYEIGILIPYLLLSIIILLFQIFIFLKKNNKIQVVIGSGIFYYTLLIINFYFLL